MVFKMLYLLFSPEDDIRPGHPIVTDIDRIKTLTKANPSLWYHNKIEH